MIKTKVIFWRAGF